MSKSFKVPADRVMDLISALRGQTCVVAFPEVGGVAVELTAPAFVGTDDVFYPDRALDPDQRRKDDPETWAMIEGVVATHGGKPAPSSVR